MNPDSPDATIDIHKNRQQTAVWTAPVFLARHRAGRGAKVVCVRLKDAMSTDTFDASWRTGATLEIDELVEHVSLKEN